MAKRSKAFTLSEVLITLGVIGIVAAMTIPALMNSTNNQETVARVKKAYSVLTQAFAQAELNEGTVDTWNWTASQSGQGATNALNTLAPYLKLNKNCGMATGCFPDVTYPYLNNSGGDYYNSDTQFAKAMLNDGTLIAVVSKGSQCENVRGTSLALKNNCGNVLIDTNGFKEPNQYGKDAFVFYITKYGIVPIGTSFETTYTPGNCNKLQSGLACTAWILEKGNMDYLK